MVYSSSLRTFGREGLRLVLRTVFTWGLTIGINEEKKRFLKDTRASCQSEIGPKLFIFGTHDRSIGPLNVFTLLHSKAVSSQGCLCLFTSTPSEEPMVDRISRRLEIKASRIADYYAVLFTPCLCLWQAVCFWQELDRNAGAL